MNLCPRLAGEKRLEMKVERNKRLNLSCFKPLHRNVCAECWGVKELNTLRTVPESYYTPAQYLHIHNTVSITSSNKS